MAESNPTQQLFDLWRKQFEEGTEAWGRLLGQPPPPAPDPFALWRPVLDQGLQQWARIFAQTPVAPDLMAQWKQFLDQWIEGWSRVLGQTMATENFAKFMGGSLDQWLNAIGPVKKAAEQQIDQGLQALNLASRTQLTSVARQIVDLEERVERVEDGIAAILGKLDELARVVGNGAAPAGDRAAAESR
jgi:hypothetical protein